MRIVLLSALGLLIHWAVVTHVTAQVAATQTLEKHSTKIGKKGFKRSAGSQATVVQMQARPVSCVTLREGQPCFIKLTVSWESNNPIQACLISEQSPEGTCWRNERSGEFKADVSLTEDTVWRLLGNQGQSLAEVEVSVAWVYKSRKSRRNWRLF